MSGNGITAAAIKRVSARYDNRSYGYARRSCPACKAGRQVGHHPVRLRSAVIILAMRPSSVSVVANSLSASRG